MRIAALFPPVWVTRTRERMLIIAENWPSDKVHQSKSNKMVLANRKLCELTLSLMFLVTYILIGEPTRIFVILLGPVQCGGGGGSSEEILLTTTQVCVRVTSSKWWFNNLRSKRAHVPLVPKSTIQGRSFDWDEKLSLTPSSFTGPTPIQLVQVSCSVSQISWDRAPTTTHQLQHHNGPVCKCEKLMSHHKNSVSPSWNLGQYLFSCSQRAAPHYSGTVGFPNEEAQSWRLLAEIKCVGLSFQLFVVKGQCRKSVSVADPVVWLIVTWLFCSFFPD